MSTEEIKARWRRFIEACGKGWAAYTAALDELFTTDFVAHVGSVDTRGLEAFKQSMRPTYEALPDFHGTIEDIIVAGDKVVMRWTMGGTHTGEFMGRPPTNRKITVPIVSIDRVVGGKIAESWLVYDTLGMMQQLGVVPTPQTEP